MSILIELAKQKGFDESELVNILLTAIKPDPGAEYAVRIELARKYLEEGVNLAEKDPIQASEKLYKAAEEAVKALAYKMRLTEITGEVERRGGWRTDDLFEAISRLSRMHGEDVRRWWATAWELHVWGFHEAKATRSYVAARIKDVENLVKLAEST